MVTAQTVGSHRLGEAYRRVIDRIASAATRVGREPKDVTLVAVTKNASPDEIRVLVEMGQRDLGESRVQQLAQRAAMLEEFLSRRRKLAGAGPPPNRYPPPTQPRPRCGGTWSGTSNATRSSRPCRWYASSTASIPCALAEEIHQVLRCADSIGWWTS